MTRAILMVVNLKEMCILQETQMTETTCGHKLFWTFDEVPEVTHHIQLFRNSSLFVALLTQRHGSTLQLMHCTVWVIRKYWGINLWMHIVEYCCHTLSTEIEIILNSSLTFFVTAISCLFLILWTLSWVYTSRKLRK